MLNQQKMEGMNSEQAQFFAFSSSRPTFSNISDMSEYIRIYRKISEMSQFINSDISEGGITQ